MKRGFPSKAKCREWRTASRAARTLFAAAIFVVAAGKVFAQPAEEATVEWIKQNAVAIKTAEAENGFEDLMPLKEIIGDARIVSLGESTHGSREIFQMKHRLLEFLVAEMGFSIFSIEANMPESYAINDYVLKGEGDAEKLIDGMYFWTWNTHEVKDMVEWMRKSNNAGKSRVEFTGFDMQTPDVAMEVVLSFLEKADEVQHAAAREAYAKARKARASAGSPFGVATGTFPVDEVRGKRVVYRGWIKTEDVDGFAGLWWRADGAEQPALAFDNMQSQQVSGTRDWRQYSIELDIPKEAVNVNFGVIMPGKGTTWFDGLEVLIDGAPFAKPETFDFDFEGDAIRGLVAFPSSSYRTELDREVAKTGKKSLRLKSTDAPAGSSPEEMKERIADCEAVHRKLVESREGLIKSHPAKEVDWAIVNARLALEAIRQRAGQMIVRDAAMAENVAWILEQNPGQKIVLWAHNGHVSKQPFAMGKYLDQKFGKDHLAIAFATTKGEYQALGPAGLSNHKLAPPPEKSYEAAFQRTGLPRFFLDLRKIDSGGEPAQWLTKSRPFRMIGALAMEEQFAPQSLPSLFDAVIYLEETTAARPLGAIQKP